MKSAAAALMVGATMLVATTAHADDEVPAESPRRVVIAGPKKDPLAARVAKELVALGFAPVPVANIEACGDVAVRAAAENADATAALCSDGAQVAVWTNDGKEFKLRDVVAPQAKGARAKEEVAMRAAEVARANLAFREPEPTPVEIAKPPPPLSTGDWEAVMVDTDHRPPPQVERIAPRLVADLGASYLASTGGATPNVSGQLSLGIHPSFSVTARVEVPISATSAAQAATGVLPDGSHVRIAPGIAGFGVEIPFAKVTERVVPRLGASAGLAWLTATKTAGSQLDPFSGTTSTVSGDSSTIFAPVAWLTGAVSVRAIGPARIVLDGLAGSTFGRLSVRNGDTSVSKWGVPLVAVALKAEVVLQ